MMMKFLCCALAPLCLFLSTVSAEEKNESDEMKVLNRFLGTWDHVITITPPGGADAIYNTVSKREWSLGKTYLRFEEVNMAEPAHEEFQMLLTFDADKKRYTGVIMDGTNSSTVSAEWDEAKAAMSFTAKHGNGNELRYKLHFTDENSAKGEGAFYDPEGNVIVGIRWKQTRREKGIE